MTRPKVSPEKRQRTAQACDSCKRRKQKCNGLQPCNTCTKRNLTCAYGPAGNSENGSVGIEDEHATPDRPAKRRNTGDQESMPQPTTQFSTAPAIKAQHLSPPPSHTKSPIAGSMPQSGGLASAINRMNGSRMTAGTQNAIASGSSDMLSRGSGGGGDGGDEEAVVYTSARMLQDPTGRLLYVGDSATLSYLQLIRMIVESSTGPNPFTMDPQRHRILENSGSLNHNLRSTHLLPDKASALTLIESFFLNTSGIVQIFNRKSFTVTFEACYLDPLSVDPSWLCLLNLVFAIGLIFANPVPGTPDDAIIKKLRSDPMDRAEVFYRNAKDLSDPTAGFEDADFWSVQALALMTVYTLAVSKRNAAYAFHGMAIRSAFALGLHREETMVIFSDEERATRRNLWRSLFVLDRFLAASLGRPTAISEEDCSGDALSNGDKPGQTGPFYNGPTTQSASVLGLEASVRSCRLIGVILKKVYSKRKISTKLAQQIADDCKGWSKNLDASLNWRQVSPTTYPNPGQGITILHVNLLYCHTIILLTRPFFLHLLHKVQQDRIVNGHRSQRFGPRMEKFSEACVIASCHSIVLVQNAWDGAYLSPRNPFVCYFLFAATLIVLSNEFSKLYDTPAAQSCIQSAINIMAYCGETDPLARRLLFILTSFRDVVSRQQDSSRIRQITDNIEDPIANLFANPMMSPTAFSNQRLNGNASSSGTNSTVNGQRRFSNPAALAGGNDPTISAPPIFLQHQPSNPNSINLHMPGGKADSPEHDRNNGRPVSVDGSDSLGDAEIDFDAFWNLPSTGMTPGIGSTPLPTPGGMNFDPTTVQGISDSIVPLYGMSEFGGA